MIFDIGNDFFIDVAHEAADSIFDFALDLLTTASTAVTRGQKQRNEKNE